MLHEFHLSPPGSGRGMSCDANGAFIGDVPLLKRSIANGVERWEPRECERLSKEITAQFGLPIDMSPKMGGVRAIANALNEGDIARAQIATVLLGIPDPPALSKGVGSRTDQIAFIRDLSWSGLIKAEWDPDEHPRWPAGAPDSQGGEFAPKGDDAPAGQTVDDAPPPRSSHGIPSDIGISPRQRFYGADVPSAVQSAQLIGNEAIGSIFDDSEQPSVSGAEDLGIYASYGRHIGDVQMASTGTIALDGVIGAARPANWANLTRLANGALRLGSGQIITAAALLADADRQRERAAVDAAINKFELDPTYAADVLAARAYVWAEHNVPLNYFEVPWSGPKLESVSQSIMALELARPGTLYLALQGDKPSGHYITVAVEDGMRAGSIFESRPRPANLPAALQTKIETARNALRLEPYDQMRAHHLIPVNIWAERADIAMLATKAGWDPDMEDNLIALPANEKKQAELLAEGLRLPMHKSNHSNYDKVARGQLIIEEEKYPGTLTPSQACAIFKDAAAEMEKRILEGEWWPRLR